MKLTMTPVAYAALAIAVITSPLMAQAQSDAQSKGLEIAKEAEARDLGWQGSKSKLQMVLQNRHGSKTTRELRRQSLEVTDEKLGDKSLVIFDSPRDIKGTALLSHTKVLDPDDQWLFLPALKRVKRISSANKSGPFVGSEFAFEDLLAQEVGKYEYAFLKEEKVDGQDCFVVRRIPRYKNSGYKKQIVWWDKAEYRVQKIEFYDRKDSLLKTLTYGGYKKYAEKYWRPDSMNMVNHQNGKQTLLQFQEWELGLKLTDSAFTPAKLKRAR
ncbi:MAG: outer membrane lipoprotein-sorting protein [Planctomycetota bacterium]